MLFSTTSTNHVSLFPHQFDHGKRQIGHGNRLVLYPTTLQSKQFSFHFPNIKNAIRIKKFTNQKTLSYEKKRKRLKKICLKDHHTLTRERVSSSSSRSWNENVQKPVEIMNSSMEAPTAAPTNTSFKYHLPLISSPLSFSFSFSLFIFFFNNNGKKITSLLLRFGAAIDCLPAVCHASENPI